MHMIDWKIASPDLGKIRENIDFGQHSENYENFFYAWKISEVVRILNLPALITTKKSGIANF